MRRLWGFWRIRTKLCSLACQNSSAAQMLWIPQVSLQHCKATTAALCNLLVFTQKIWIVKKISGLRNSWGKFILPTIYTSVTNPQNPSELWQVWTPGTGFAWSLFEGPTYDDAKMWRGGGKVKEKLLLTQDEIEDGETLKLIVFGIGGNQRFRRLSTTILSTVLRVGVIKTVWF